MTERNALIVGASRGLGLGLVEMLLQRGWAVTATARKPSAGLNALAGAKLHTEIVDIDDDAAVASLHGRLKTQRFDLIFVVAGISVGRELPLHEVPRDSATQIFQTNSVSPVRFAEAFSGLIAPGGTMALMTSGLGSVSMNTRGGWEIYRASKAALNTLTRSFALRHEGKGWDVVLMHPGWVRTDMGGSAADIDVETSVKGMLDVMEKPGRTGCSYLDYKGDTLSW
jgi:NAD(P)-dependent dehydrogenase (short-subunit alcohol dehydrogenase family)